MITFKEYIGSNLISAIPIEHQHSIERLLEVIEKFIAAYGKPVKMSSGYRSKQKQLDIYRAKGIPDNKIPMASGHLRGLAIDLVDTDGALDEFCNKNQDLLESLGLWQENPASTKNWLHLDLIPREMKNRPNCLKRQFNP